MCHHSGKWKYVAVVQIRKMKGSNFMQLLPSPSPSPSSSSLPLASKVRHVVWQVYPIEIAMHCGRRWKANQTNAIMKLSCCLWHQKCSRHCLHHNSHLLFIPWSWWYEYMNSCHKSYPTRSTNCVCRLHLPCCFGVIFYKQQHNWWIIDGAIMAVPFIKLETNKHCAGANGAVLSRIKLIPVAWRLFIRRQMLI